MKKTILALVAALILTLAPVALAAVNVVSPTDDFYVNDAAGVLSAATKGHIVLNNDALNEACGAQIVIVTVDSVGDATMEEYASTLFDEWNIGSSEKNNGLLLVMSIDDDDYWMTEGKGLRSAITAGDIGELLDTYLEPYFAEKDYDDGAKALFDATFAAVCKAEGLNLKVDQNAYASYLAENGIDEPEEPVSEPVGTDIETQERAVTSVPAFQSADAPYAGDFSFLHDMSLKEMLALREALDARIAEITETAKTAEAVNPSDTGIWEIRYYVDVFRNPTDKDYITNKEYFTGTFSNSAATDS